MSLRCSSYVAPKPQGGSKTQNGRFLRKIALHLKKVCYKVSLCENCHRQSCKAFIGLTICAKVIGGGHVLNVNFALSEPVLGALAVLISAFTKFDKYSICIAFIPMEYDITNSVH